MCEPTVEPPGPDGISVAAFPEVFRSQWPKIRQQLLDGTYQPLPARRKSIPKEDGPERHLGIPNILERLIQQSIMQILANVLLDDLDKELEKRGLRFVRYADDFLVFTKSETASKRVYESIGNYLTQKLKLVVNHQKSRTCSTDGVEFLGFIFRGCGGQIRVSPKKIKKFKDSIREITRRNRGVSMQLRLIELRRYIQGWVGYFRLVPLKSLYDDLDKWIRRCVRACFCQQWRNPRTRIRNLLKLGVREHEAHTHGSRVKALGSCRQAKPFTWPCIPIN